MLNKSSLKKRDVRSVLTTLDATGVDRAAGVQNPPASQYAVSPATINGVTNVRALYIPTAQSLYNFGTSQINAKGNSSRRSASTCFMVGIKERCQFYANTAVTWRLRRICFKIRGPGLLVNITNGTSYAGRNVFENSDGNFRVWTPVSPGQTNAINNLLFEGTPGLDWQSEFTAKVDVTRVDKAFDRVVHFRSGNSSPHIHTLNFWHKMRKNLVYDDEESGGVMATSSFSTQGKPGMGDYYIYDIIDCVGGASTDLLTVGINSTLYWHEK